MIVLKSTQDKILAVLQSIAGILDRRHELPVLAKVLIYKTGANPTAPKPSASNAYLFTSLQTARKRAMLALPRGIGFFSATKANLRNAP